MHPLAVDLFMVLSGFLMVHTWKGGSDSGVSGARTTLSFYIGRLFRIAPLYYFLLLVCALALPELASMHDGILKAFPPPWVAGGADYAPHTAWYFGSLEWLFLHATFLFGVVPGMEASTPLPDWSLSLEMQFYLVFPFLLVLCRKMPLMVLAVFASTLSFYAPALFGNYLDAGSLAHFGQPSLLAYRLNAFLAGMIVAYWLKERGASPTPSVGRALYIGLTAAVCVIPLTKLVILAYGLFILLAVGNAPPVTRVFSFKLLRFLGDISYSIYLCHLLVVIPVVHWLISETTFTALNPLARFIVAVLVTGPVVIMVSMLLYQRIELPPLKIARRLIKKIRIAT